MSLSTAIPRSSSLVTFKAMTRSLQLAQPDPADRVVVVLAQHQGGPRAGRGDVRGQVGSVDLVPDPAGLGDRLDVRQRGVLREVRLRVAERRLAQAQEP